MSKKISWAIFILQLVCLGFFANIAQQLPQDNSIDSFAVKGDVSQANYEILQREFSNIETFLVSIEFPTEDSPNWHIAEEICMQLADDPAIVKYRSFLGEFPGSLREQMNREGGNTDSHLPFPFVNGHFYTCIFELGDVTSQAREQLIANSLEKIAYFRLQYPQVENVTLYGEPVVNYYLGRSSLDIKEKFFPILLVLSIGVLGIVFKSWKVLIIAFFSVISSLTTTMAVFALSGNSLNLVTNLIPVIVFVLAVAMQLHILLSFYSHSSISEALREKMIPNFLVTLTTSIGFGSLMSSQVVPIFLLGKYMAIGMWIILGWSYLTHLGLSHLISLEKVNASSRVFLLTKPIRDLPKPGVSMVIPLAVLVSSYFIMSNNPLESNGLNYFPEGHPIRRQTRSMEKSITGGSNIEILLPRHNNGDVLDFALYQKIQAFEERLLQLPNIRHLISLRAQLQLVQKAISGFDQYDEEVLRFESADSFTRVYQEIVANDPQLLSQFLSRRHYRIQVLCNSLGSPEFAELKAKIHRAYREAQLDDSPILTGPLVRVTETQAYLLSSLATSLSMTVVLSLALMAAFLRHWQILYVGIVPNLFPLGAMAVFIWVFQYPTTISTVMVFSIAFGIAVDSTIHLFHSFYTSKAENFQQKWRHSVEVNGIAVFLTTVVLAGGFSVVALSSFLPTRHFGILLSFGMIAAFIGDVVFLPIILRWKTRN